LQVQAGSQQFEREITVPLQEHYLATKETNLGQIGGTEGRRIGEKLSVTTASERLESKHGRPTTDNIMTELFEGGHRIRSVYRDQIIYNNKNINI
jgi:hypothetical protein